MMVPHEITFEIVPAERLLEKQKTEILDLCSAAYQESFGCYLELLPSPIHILARHSGILVSHAAWVTRWLQVGTSELLQTAYVEAVATAPEHQGQSFGSAVLHKLVKCIDHYHLGALSPSDVTFYERLGWELWRGPLAIRTEDGLLPTPDEEVMIYRLPRTPNLDSGSLLSAEWRQGEMW